MKHEIKIKRDFADAVLVGDKTFEIRKNDRGYQKHDLIQFKVMDRDGYCFDSFHKLNKKTYEITYVINGYGLKNGYVVFGMREVSCNG